MKKMLTAVALIGLLTCGRASAVFYNGEELMEVCAIKIAFVNRACEGYVTGIADAASHFRESDGVAEDFCIPQETKSVELIRVVVKFLEAHAGSLGANAAEYVRAALAESYPCA